MLKIEIPKNSIIRVFGPALLSIVDGSIEVLGKRYSRGEKLVVHKVRSYPVIALENTVIEANLGPEASIQEVAGEEDPILDWINTVENIVGSGYKKIVVLGPIDSGKSSLTILLANKLLDKGVKTAVVDSDVGQADIGPPCFISLSIYREPVIWMRELKPDIMKFIGDIRPQYYVDKIVYEVKNLVEYALDRLGIETVIIDTDGWIGDSYAIEYKSRLIETIMPDAIIVLGKQLHGIFKKYESLGMKVHELETPKQLRTRSREERRWLRSEQYKKFLEEASVKRYSIDKIVLSGHPLFRGIELSAGEVSKIIGHEVLYASRNVDTLTLVLQSHTRNIQSDKLKESYNVSRIRYYVAGFEKGLYVALSDGEKDYPGIVVDIDYKGRTIAVKTLYNEVPRIIKFSRIRLNENYLEQIIE